MKRNVFSKVYLIILLCFILLSLPYKFTNQLRQPLLRLVRFPLEASANLVNFLFHYSDYKKLIAENSALQQRNIELSLENSSLKYLKRENDNLTSLLALKKQFTYASIASRVIGLDYSDTTKIIFLDSGSEQGVKENMVCLNASGLIGKVIEVGKEMSKVICLNDPNSRVPAKLERLQDQGLVYGTLNGVYLEMRYLKKDSKIVVGERIITSGLGSIYPKGLLIGTVAAIRKNRFYKTALILPAVDLIRLEKVILVEKSGEK